MTILPNSDRWKMPVTTEEPHECPRCGCYTPHWWSFKGETYCYQCVPNETGPPVVRPEGRCE